MGILIDSSILVAYEKGRLDVPAEINLRGVVDARLSVIVASEMLHGIARAKNPAIQAKRTKFVEQLLVDFPVVAIDVTTARIHGGLWADLETRGVMIGRHDSWIAATCLQHGLTIVTANEQEFRKVPGLAIENWLVP
jgi:predicted nucleic acid-binding protein